MFSRYFKYFSRCVVYHLGIKKNIIPQILKRLTIKLLHIYDLYSLAFLLTILIYYNNILDSHKII